jgi:FSR family fosmidomycin resistance protein-like MFS transporter
MLKPLRHRFIRRIGTFTALALAYEFMDELVDGADRAAIPLIRDDLTLSYEQLGLIYGLPILFSTVIEPFLGVAADTRWRKWLVLVGTFGYALAMLATGMSGGFWALLIATTVYAISSGASVSVTQAALMDADPERREQNMVRWDLSGSVANLVGPLAVGAAVWVGIGWRGLYILIGVGMLALLVWAWRARRQYEVDGAPDQIDLVGGFRDALRQLRRFAVVRWLVLLESADLLGDIFRGFMALYFIDVVGLDESFGGAALLLYTAVGLVGDVAIIRLLERINGLRYLRWSVALALVLYPAFLLVEPLALKLVLLSLLGIGNAGWYSILQARLYAEIPDRSGTVMVLGSALGIFAGLIPVLLGWAAQQFGLNATMWLLLLGPVVLLLGIPRRDYAILEEEDTKQPPP